MTDSKPNCHDCWWADFKEDAPGKHLIVNEPDMLTMQNMGDEPKEIRVVQTCAKGKGYFKSYGAMPHDCKGFEHSAARQAELDKEIDAKRKAWTHPTSRVRLTSSTNLFLHMERMAEKLDPAYDILIDSMTMEPHVMSQMLIDLDDMNIRGEQIVIAFTFCGQDLYQLASDAKTRNPNLVQYVNSKFARSSEEQAVPRGAHLYGHRKPVKPKPKPVLAEAGKPVRPRPTKH